MRTTLLILITLFVAEGAVYSQQSSADSGILTMSAEGKTLLEIRTPQNLPCVILVETHAGNTVKVEYSKWSKAKSFSQEKRFIDLIEIKLDDKARRSDGLRLRVLTPIKAPWESSDYSAGVKFEILVPENFSIESRSSSSSIHLDGPFSEVWVDNEYGPVKVENVKGKVVIKTSDSEVELSDVEGEVRVETSFSKIKASDLVLGESPGLFETSYQLIELDDIKGSVEAYTSNNYISANDINAGSGSVVLKTSHGQIRAKDITGELVCETSYHPVELENISLTHGVNMIETKYAPVNLDIKSIDDAQLFVSNTYGSINIALASDLSAKLILDIDEGGRIHTQGISIKPLVMERNRLEGIVGDGLAKIELTVDGIGEINVKGR